MGKKVLVAKPFYKKFSPTGYRMLLDRGYDVVTTDLDRDYFLILARYGVGMNSVDTEAARRHGVICTNCPGINANPVAEHVMAMLLGALRDLPNLNESTKKGLWKTGIFRELTGATVGILGFGFIGQLVAKKLTGFDCRVLAYDIAPNYEAAAKTGVTFTGFEELLSQSDYIIILVPLVPDTFEMINRETLKISKPGAVFVSDARGEVVDEEAMYEALVSGQVSYFATDVFVHEPATPENTPLLTLPNVIATPHNGAETYENGERCGILTAQQIIDALEGREPAHRRV